MDKRIKQSHPELTDFAEWLERQGYLYPNNAEQTLNDYWGGECICGKDE
jgi:hypothetical protein